MAMHLTTAAPMTPSSRASVEQRVRLWYEYL